MQDAKDPKSTGIAGGEDTSTESKDPKSDATSNETLSDLEEEGKVSGGKNDDGGEQSSATPSPDGAFDEGGQSGPREDPGPM